MALDTGLIIGSALVAIISLALYYAFHHHSRYWITRGVPSIAPVPLLGNIWKVVFLKSPPGNVFIDLYNASTSKVSGIFILHKPALLVRCPDLIRTILVKDFHCFTNRYMATHAKNDKLATENLFFLRTPHWGDLKKQLTPVFTIAKVKKLFELVNEIGKSLDQYLANLIVVKTGQEVMVDVQDISALYTTDTITTFAYGVNANCLKDPDAVFRKASKEQFEGTALRALEFYSMFFFPQITGFFNFSFFSKLTGPLIRQIVWDSIKVREKSGTTRNDLIDTFIKMKNLPYSGEGLKYEGDTLIAQAAVFFTGGFETSSATMTFTLYELALHQEIQDQLRQEIRQTLEDNDGQINYDIIMNMTYLDMVLSEALRKYPSLPFLERELWSESGYDLPEPYADVTLSPGTPVYIPIMALHMDPQYFPDPERFDPNRFTKEARQARHPYVYLPFGTGPRACIGERFGLLQTKTGLFYFLKNYRFKICSETIMPVKLNPKAILLSPNEKIILSIQKVE